MKTRNILLRISFSLFTLFLVLSCEKNETVVPSEEQNGETSESVTPAIRESMITFLTGEVKLKEEGEAWRFAEIGDYLTEGDSIQTGMDGYCELQVGGISMVRVDSDTYFSISRLETSGEEREIGLALNEGTIASKVKKLAGGDQFEVTIPTATCGIRGTQFTVTYKSGDKTLLAVQEGSVSFQPQDGQETIDIPNLDERILVEPGQQIELTEEEFQNILRISNSPSKEESSEEIVELLQGKLAPLGSENAEKMEGLEEEILYSDEMLLNPPEIPLSIRIEPENSRILINGTLIRSGRFQDMQPQGKVLNISTEAYGYYPVDEQFTVEPDSNGKMEILITLEKKPVQQYIFNLSPPDTVIRVDGATLDENNAIEVMEGEEHLVGFLKTGYNSLYRNLSFLSEESQTEVLELNKTIERVLSASTSSIIGISGNRNLIICSDGDGALTALSPQGSKLWFRTTANYPNPNQRPLIHINRVYLTGTKTLDMIQFNQSDVVGSSQRELGKEELQFFESSMQMVSGNILYPTSEGFSILNPENGNEISSVTIPEGSRMTPVLFNGHYYSVNQKGVIYKFDASFTQSGSLETPLGTVIGQKITFFDNAGYFADKTGRVCSFNPQTMTVNWTADLPGSDVSVSHDIIADSNYLYIYSTGRIFRLNRFNGRGIQIIQSDLSSYPCIENQFLYGGTEEGRIIIIDTSNNKLLFQHNLAENETISSFAEQINDKIYLGSSAGNIYVINPQDVSIRLSYGE